MTWFNNTVKLAVKQSSLCEGGLVFLSQFHSSHTSKFRVVVFIPNVLLIILSGESLEEEPICSYLSISCFASEPG